MRGEIFSDLKILLFFFFNCTKAFKMYAIPCINSCYFLRSLSPLQKFIMSMSWNSLPVFPELFNISGFTVKMFLKIHLELILVQSRELHSPCVYSIFLAVFSNILRYFCKKSDDCSYLLLFLSGFCSIRLIYGSVFCQCHALTVVPE